MVDLQSMKNQARIDIKKDQNQTTKKYTRIKCINMGRWVGSGLKVIALCINMNIHHDLGRINTRTLNKYCRSMKNEEDPTRITSNRHLQT